MDIIIRQKDGNDFGAVTFVNVKTDDPRAFVNAVVLHMGLDFDGATIIHDAPLDIMDNETREYIRPESMVA